MRNHGWSNYQTCSIHFWVTCDKACHKQWRRFRWFYRIFTPQNARATLGGIFFEETPDGVSIGDPKINWEELANAWNEDRSTLQKMLGERRFFFDWWGGKKFIWKI